MPTYGMGEAIREMRNRLGCTQEELSYGICTAGTLSRIENGRAVVSKQVFEALCSRMPGLHHVWVACDTKVEMLRSRLCKQILHELEFHRLREAKAAIDQYRIVKNDKNIFCRQFEGYTTAIYHAIAKEDEEYTLPMLKQALSLTLPDYKERLSGAKKSIMLTYDEIYIFINMAIAYAKHQDADAAFSIFYFLKRHMEKQGLETIEAMKTAPMIFGNLAWLLEKAGRFQEAVRQCENGIQICHITGKYAILPHLLCIKARCMAAVGNHRTAVKFRRQAESILDVTEEYRGYGSFEELYKAREPIYVTL